MLRLFSVLLIAIVVFLGCDGQKTSQVVIYTALDRRFSEPVLKKFTKETGIKVKTKYDTESTKTVGLTACIIEEARHPRCDVFWNNEILNTLRLQNLNLLEPYRSPNARDIPEQFCDAKGYWTGFAARCRVLLINTRLVPIEQAPRKLFDLLAPRWRGKVGIARPIAGTTASHVACLFSVWGEKSARQFLYRLRQNKVVLASGNKSCAEKVGNGELAMGLTDTDDAMLEIVAGKPVAIVYLGQEKDGLGSLFIPNTLALIKNSPNPVAARRLIDFLLSPEVEKMLARGESAQIPLHSQLREAAKVKTPWQIKPMAVNFADAAHKWEQARHYILTEFLLR